MSDPIISETPTPRTDQAFDDYGPYLIPSSYDKMTDFARTLEREIIALRATVAELQRDRCSIEEFAKIWDRVIEELGISELNFNSNPVLLQMQRELDEAKAVIEGLRENGCAGINYTMLENAFALKDMLDTALANLANAMKDRDEWIKAHIALDSTFGINVENLKADLAAARRDAEEKDDINAKQRTALMGVWQSLRTASCVHKYPTLWSNIEKALALAPAKGGSEE